MELDCSLGEMKDEAGDTLRHEVEEMATDIAGKLFHTIQDYLAYQEIADKIKSPKTRLYFQKAIRMEVYAAVRKFCIIRGYKRQNIMIKGEDATVVVPAVGIYPLLEKVWPHETVTLKLERKWSNKEYSSHFKSSICSSIRGIARELIDKALWVYYKTMYANAFDDFGRQSSKIALEYAEGLDLERRSDIVWFPESMIDPNRILVYFRGPDGMTGEPVGEDILRRIEGWGMKWVSLKRGALRRKGVPVWYPFGYGKKIDPLDKKPCDDIEKWICKIGKRFIKELNYWLAFYAVFNIKIHFTIGEGDLQHIAQSIAFNFNMNGSGIGFLAFKQRSELFWPARSFIAHYPMDVFFSWAPRAAEYIDPNLNMTRSIVAVGYPNDLVFIKKHREAEKRKKELRSKGARFIVALFDATHNQVARQSTRMMESFYTAFIHWLLADENVGLVIKSKKPVVLNNLPRVLPLLAEAEATGRCIRIFPKFGTMPIEAAAASDMAVGIGISTAVIESVIAGCRGIHCDLPCLQSHEFYEWGYERIIFDDLDRLMIALKQYKDDKSNKPGLGDWTPFLDKLDPFRDGCAGKRMGTYLRWALEGFDSGKKQNEAIANANQLHSRKWGKDKVINYPTTG